MQARGRLMIGHRLIERMHAIIQGVVDLIGKPADQTHHGKEEDVFFQQLRKCRLSAHDRTMPTDLLERDILRRQLINIGDSQYFFIMRNTRYSRLSCWL